MKVISLAFSLLSLGLAQQECNTGEINAFAVGEKDYGATTSDECVQLCTPSFVLTWMPAFAEGTCGGSGYTQMKGTKNVTPPGSPMSMDVALFGMPSAPAAPVSMPATDRHVNGHENGHCKEGEVEAFSKGAMSYGAESADDCVQLCIMEFVLPWMPEFEKGACKSSAYAGSKTKMVQPMGSPAPMAVQVFSGAPSKAPSKGKKSKGKGKGSKLDRTELGATVAMLTSILLDNCDKNDKECDPNVPFTVFAPSDFAVTMAEVSLSGDKKELAKVVKNHVIRGQALTSFDLTEAAPTTYQSWEGFPLEITTQGKKKLVNGVNIVRQSFVSDTAVVHVITKILPLPKAQPVVETIAATPSLSALTSLVTLPELEKDLAPLSGPGPFTVFAPSNDAVANLKVALNDPEQVGEVLKYHVVPGAAVFSGDLKASQTVTAFNGGKLVVKRAEDGSVTVNGANVVQADLKADNGVIHIIDQVLLPLSNLVETAQATPELSTLVAVVSSPGLEDIAVGLSSQGFFNQRPSVWGPFTVFAPINSAFESVAVDPSDLSQVDNVLRYHIVPGDILSTDMEEGTSMIWALNGDLLTLKKENGEVYINDAKVLTADIKAENGVVHLIDTVLIPPVDGSTKAGSSTQGEVALDQLRWDVINDSVMGGISTSTATLSMEGDTPVITFSGLATTDSNGGFVNAYGRTGDDDRIDMSNCEAIKFTAMADGDGSQRYEFSIESGEQSMWMGGSSRYVNFFPTSEWDTYEFKLDDFKEPSSGGFGGFSNTKFDNAEISSVGLKRSAFIDGFTKDPDFVSGAFNLKIKDVQCASSSSGSSATAKTMNPADLQWEVINDTVMGGISRSSIQLLPSGDTIQFSGLTTTDSNGGFTNSYGRFPEPIDLSDCTAIAFDARGDNTRYTFSLRSGEMGMFGGASTVDADFYPPTEWTRLVIPMSEMTEPQGFGGFGAQTPFNPSESSAVGLSHSAFLGGLTKDPDFVSGPFKMEMRNLECVAA